jgi:hypothetical protein
MFIVSSDKFSRNLHVKRESSSMIQHLADAVFLGFITDELYHGGASDLLKKLLSFDKDMFGHALNSFC